MFNIRAANSYLLFVEVPHPRAAPFYGGVISDSEKTNTFDVFEKIFHLNGFSYGFTRRTIRIASRERAPPKGQVAIISCFFTHLILERKISVFYVDGV